MLLIQEAFERSLDQALSENRDAKVNAKALS
jgi:hypothetical protein